MKNRVFSLFLAFVFHFGCLFPSFVSVVFFVFLSVCLKENGLCLDKLFADFLLQVSLKCLEQKQQT